MIEVSDAWKAAHAQAVLPETFVEITMDVFDSDVSSYISRIEDSPAASFSNSDAIVNALSYQDSGKYALLEQNLWVLDGTKEVISSVSSYTAPGYVSEKDDVGVLTAYTSTARGNAIPGFTIVWSAEHNEYATDFTVGVYNDSTLIASKRVTNNDSVDSVVPLSVTTPYNRVTVTINKWNAPNHRKRIDSLCYGFHWVFDKNEIISYTHEQIGDVFSAEVSQNKITFSLDNSRDTWNPINPQGLGKYLSEQQKVTVRYGTDINGAVEWIPGGQFYLSEWSASSNGLEASFEAKDSLSILGQSYYSREFVYGIGKATSYDQDMYRIFSEPCDPQDEASEELVIGTVEVGTKYQVYEIYLDSYGGMTGYKITKEGGSQSSAGWCIPNVISIQEKTFEETMLDAVSSAGIQLPVEVNYTKHTNNKVVNWAFSDESIWVIDKTPTSEMVQLTANATSGMHKTERDGSIRMIWDWPSNYRMLSLSDYVIPLDLSMSYPEVDLAKPIKDVSLNGVYPKDMGVPTGQSVNVDNFLLQDDSNPMHSSSNPYGDMRDWYVNYVPSRILVKGEFRADPRLDLFDLVSVETKYGTISPVIITRIKYTYNGTFWGSFEGKRRY